MAGKRFGHAIAVVAILLGVSIAATLAVMDVSYAQKVREQRERASRRPAITAPGGKLLGQNLLDGSEWTQIDDGRFVLFSVAETGQPGDLQFWYDVVSDAQVAAPTVQFVGLCTTGRSCSPPPRAQTQLTLLSSASPTLVHALATAASQGKAFLGRDTRVQTTIQIQERQAFVNQIAVQSRAQQKVRGP
jgi:hypothetical protein